jgi:hypothetical protein
MSVLDDFVRIRLYRERASEFELLAEAEASPDVQRRFRVIARHYRELMDRELQADKARMAELIERARLQRQQAVLKASLPATSQGAVEIVKSTPLAAEHEIARRESVPVEGWFWQSQYALS